MRRRWKIDSRGVGVTPERVVRIVSVRGVTPPVLRMMRLVWLLLVVEGVGIVSYTASYTTGAIDTECLV